MQTPAAIRGNARVRTAHMYNKHACQPCCAQLAGFHAYLARNQLIQYRLKQQPVFFVNFESAMSRG